MHNASVLPSVTVDSYNVEVEDDEGFIGDKASKGAFWELVDKWRKPLNDAGEDPLGNMPSEDFGKKKLVDLLSDGEPEAAALVLSSIEEFAQNLAYVIRRFTRVRSGATPKPSPLAAASAAAASANSPSPAAASSCAPKVATSPSTSSATTPTRPASSAPPTCCPPGC